MARVGWTRLTTAAMLIALAAVGCTVGHLAAPLTGDPQLPNCGFDLLMPPVPAVGSNDAVHITSLVDSRDPFSPGNVDGEKDSTTLTAVASVDPAWVELGGGVSYLVRASFEIASPVSCTDLTVRTQTVPITPSTPIAPGGEYVPVLDVVWYGDDDAHEDVPEGTYFYRVVVRLLKSSGGEEVVLDEATSGVATMTIDNSPPALAVSDPLPNLGVPAVRGEVLLRGTVWDSSGLDSAVVKDAFGSVDLEPSAGGDFSVTRPLDASADPVEQLNEYSLEAMDGAGNVASIVLPIYAVHVLALMRASHRLLNPGAGDLSLSALRRNLFATASMSDLLLDEFGVPGIPDVFDAIFNPPPPLALLEAGTISESTFTRGGFEHDVRGVALHPTEPFAALASFDGRITFVDVSGSGWAIDDAGDPRVVCQIDVGGAANPTSVHFGPAVGGVVAVAYGGEDNSLHVGRFDPTGSPVCCEIGSLSAGANILSVRFDDGADLIAVGTTAGLRVISTDLSGAVPACGGTVGLLEVLDVSTSLNAHGADFGGGLLAYTLSPAPGIAGVSQLVLRSAAAPFAVINTEDLPGRAYALDLLPDGSYALVGLGRDELGGTSRYYELTPEFLMGTGGAPFTENDTGGRIHAVAFADDGASMAIAEESITAGRPGRSSVGYAYAFPEFAVTPFADTGTTFRDDLRAVALATDGTRLILAGSNVAAVTRDNVVVYERTP